MSSFSFLSRLRSRLGSQRSWVGARLAGKDFTVRKGTIPEQPDYDYAWQVACARRARVVIDVGANIGQTAFNVLLSESVEELVLVEANPAAWSMAAENLIHNGMSGRVRFVTAFVGAEADTTVEFWTVGVGAAGSVHAGHAKTASQRGSTMRIETTTLDALVCWLGLEPDLVIVDVEGAEGDVLAGAREVAEKCSPRFLVEMHSPHEIGGMKGNAKMVLRWCEEMGYRAWYLSDGVELSACEQIAHRGRCHLLLQREPLEFPAWLSGIPQGAPVAAGLQR